MNKFKHTPEPWTFEKSHNDMEAYSFNSPTEGTLGCINEIDPITDKANASRIVSCVNGCAGIQDPVTTVPALITALFDVIDAYGCECINYPPAKPHCPMCIGRAVLANVKVPEPTQG